jgi:2-polyprenyl-3-methyl-5-hydroxy-6-metoxy-1,4-benzoquinol methylase
MTTAREHYDNHLGTVYSWMLGDFDALITRNTAELQSLNLLNPSGNALAIDLGAGPGAHTVPLARAGYRVLAIDTCDALNGELASRTRSLPVQIVQDGLENFRAHTPTPAQLILCMGDTLTHLPTAESVDQLLIDVVAALAPGGSFVTTFRDYVSAELRGPRRFISVRSSADRILTCLLEYSTDHVLVHDLLHERVDGEWRMQVSAYPKLRLDPAAIAVRLAGLGTTVQSSTTASGMARIVARKRAANSE